MQSPNKASKRMSIQTIIEVAVGERDPVVCLALGGKGVGPVESGGAGRPRGTPPLLRSISIHGMPAISGLVCHRPGGGPTVT
jgi:hypothetical protein